MTHKNKIKSLTIIALFFSVGLPFSPKLSFLTRSKSLIQIHDGDLPMIRSADKDSFAGCDIVTVECHLRPEGSFVPEALFDGVFMDDDETHNKTLTFALGKGNYLPGLHDLISTLNEGESVHNQTLDAGWGAWNPDLEATLSFDSIQNSGIDISLIQPGVELVMGNGIKATVTERNGDESFKVDANPPLAGASYSAYVKLISKVTGPDSGFLYPPLSDSNKIHVATFAFGCFWGAELAFMRENGVVGTKVGYTQGQSEYPTYKEVCSGSTGHTESVMVLYDSEVVSYARLVELMMDRLGENKFLKNQVGNDRGTQYRHGIYYHNDDQKSVATSAIESFGEDCVTEVLPAKVFYDAEDYHQQYLLKGGQSAKKGDTSFIRCYG
ncbi:unnamed protein product [Cylindrotheca closterium]|uniref:peptide-methionine (S)-S-oxide reductase n=1 Tax=Cylindrotheca closterium TaxID=2856 RepID=A0AAD2CVL6_9STRA|nr:unnamed protein product [Cylindrotheca closterium]